MPETIWLLQMLALLLCVGAFAGVLAVSWGWAAPLFFFPPFSLLFKRLAMTGRSFGVVIAVPWVIGLLMVDLAGPVSPMTVGAVNLPAFAVIIAMILVTAPWGVKIAHAMDPKPLKHVFAVFLILVALNMLRGALLG